MVMTAANAPDEDIASLPDDRRAAMAAVRGLVNANLPDGYAEGSSTG